MVTRWMPKSRTAPRPSGGATATRSRSVPTRGVSSRLSRRATVALLAAGILLYTAGAALAAWSATGFGPAAATSTHVPQGPQPAATVTGRNVSLSWAQQSLANGASLDGYRIVRYGSGGGSVSASCNPAASNSCVDDAVAPGTWGYAVIPVKGPWSGVESATRQVNVPAPSLALGSTEVKSLPGAVTANVAAFVTGQSVTFRLNNADTGQVVGSSGAVPFAGTASATLTIPAGTSNGTHTIYAVGSAGDIASAELIVSVPQPVPTSLALNNGSGQTRRIDAGDTIVITYSEPIAVSSFCSGWSGDNSNQSLAWASVDVADRSTSGDIVTLRALGCDGYVFNFGSIDLGHPGYLSADVSFGTASSPSTITWNASTRTLRIVVGERVGSTNPTNRVSTATTNAAVYTPSGITSVNGAAVTGTVSRPGPHF